MGLGYGTVTVSFYRHLLLLDLSSHQTLCPFFLGVRKFSSSCFFFLLGEGGYAKIMVKQGENLGWAWFGQA